MLPNAGASRTNVIGLANLFGKFSTVLPHCDTMGFTRFLGNPPYRCFY